MTSAALDRISFQRDCVMESTWNVLNVGCHIDPAGLKHVGGGRVINCDYRVQPGYDYKVDAYFDVRERWPFEDGFAELVVLGDILEHLYDHEIMWVLMQARRVADKLCVTVPHDEHLAEHDPEDVVKPHCNTIDEIKIRMMLRASRWKIVEFHTISWVVSEHAQPGYLIAAR